MAMNNSPIIDTFEVRTVDQHGTLVLVGCFSDYSEALKSKNFVTDSFMQLAGDYIYTFWIEGTSPRRQYEEDGSYTLIEETIIPSSYQPDRPPSGTSISTPLTPTWTNLTPQN